MSTWLRLFVHNIHDWIFVHPETGTAVCLLSLALSASAYIAIKSGRSKK